MEEIIKIEGKKIGLKASAGTVRLYRDVFARDLIIDIGTLEEEILKNKQMTMESSAIAENAIYIMAKEYDPELPPINDWLSEFSPYFVYSAIVHVIAMWHRNTATLNKSKKK